MLLTCCSLLFTITGMAQFGPPQSNEAGTETRGPGGAGQGDLTELYEKLKLQIPEPSVAREFVKEALQEELTPAERKYYEDGLGYLKTIDRANVVGLSLRDVIEKTLEHSYNIRVQSYDPAIAATQVVEAESVFDMIFFSNATWNKNNRPTSTALSATDSRNAIFNTGLRKFLPTGMSVEAAWNVDRTEFEGFAFATLNPSYRNELAFQVRQPFLRGFGLDFNRSQINLTLNSQRGSEYEFRRAVQDHLLNAEEAYWQLDFARRNLVIEGRLIAEFQQIYDYLYARRNFDASPVEISQSKAALDIQVAAFARVKQAVRDAEDQLKSLVNDPNLNLADDIEIVTTEFPSAEPLVVDRLAELQAALDNREELKEAKLAIDSASIGVGVAKNQALPRFDVIFNYTFDALGKSQHDSFQNLSDLDFHNYTVGLQFEWPIGNRGPRAALRRARQQHAQSMASLKLLIEQILLSVNVAVRDLNTNYEQINANLRAVESQIDEVNAIVERAERRDPNQLNRELGARQRLAGSRQNLLQSLLAYNLGISRLERAKGTLLEYDNVVVGDAWSQPE